MSDDYGPAIWKPSPNFGYASAIGRGGQKVRAIVDHIAAGSEAGLDATFAIVASQVSAHYGVMRSGAVHQYVREQDAAWHAGILNTPDVTLPWLPVPSPAAGRMVNERSLGIEHEGQSGEPFTPEQLAATIALHKHLAARWGVPVDREYIVGHCRLDSVNRAQCPGPAFPWDALFAALGEGAGGAMTEAQIVIILRLFNEAWGRSTAEEQAAMVAAKTALGIAGRIV